MTAPAWHLSNRFDPRALPLANRHYNRQKPGTPQFVAPGSNLVLLSAAADALWVTLVQQHVQHAWPRAWNCSLFRNESGALSSSLIRAAVAASVWRYGPPPPEGFITFIDPSRVRAKQDPGYCYLRAGWVPSGVTGKGLLVLRLAPEDFGAPVPPGPMLGTGGTWQPSLFAA